MLRSVLEKASIARGALLPQGPELISAFFFFFKSAL